MRLLLYFQTDVGATFLGYLELAFYLLELVFLHKLLVEEAEKVLGWGLLENLVGNCVD
jgi:hypothetical protein